MVRDTNAAPFLRVEDVHFDYRTEAEAVHALRGVSCAFEEGRIYAITGRSGCGKTTFLSLLAGFDKPLSGTVSYKGRPVSEIGLAEYRRQNVGMIFQSYYLIPQLTAIENVLLALEFTKIPKKERREIAREHLLKVGITEEKHKKRVTHLSGGEQQRVAIARSIAAEPSILLADEPTGNLDTENGQIVLDILIRLAHERGKCVILVTHSEEIASMADVRLRMQDGRFVG